LTFSLDPRLEQASVFVCELALSQVRLLNDSRFPWALLVPRVSGASELFDLNEADAQMLNREIRTVSLALKAFAPCDKINVGALGNKVRQLHVHVIARRQNDAAWPGAVWDKGDAVPYAKEAKAALVEELRAALASAT
jgi:diadenosine tetraphosphate (Ap4A) HIT family hydrolase